MKRAEFLKVMGAGTLAAIAGSLATACKSSSTTPSNPDSKVFTSSTTLTHQHTITIQKTEVETPPAGGISRETSSVGHTHTFTMTAADLATVKSGTAVNIDTAETNAHHHTFTISKWY